LVFIISNIEDKTFIITYKTNVLKCGLFENNAIITGNEDEIICDSDESSAIVEVTGCNDIVVCKYIKENCDGQWDPNGITINLDEGGAEWVTFRIEVENTGDVPLEVEVKDILPYGLVYNNHATPKEPDYISGQKLYWYFDGSECLEPGETVVIEFRASKDGDCDVKYNNCVYVTGECDCCDSVDDSDCAWVEWLCGGDCDIEVRKSVKENCNGPWDSDGIIIDLDEGGAEWVTFRIEVENIGDVDADVTVKDVLPFGLNYYAHASISSKSKHKPTESQPSSGAFRRQIKGQFLNIWQITKDGWVQRQFCQNLGP